VRGDRNQGLPGAGRRGEHHVVCVEQLDRGLLLMGIEAQTLLRRPAGERVEEGVGAGLGGKGVDEAHASLRPR
jgi:hypothetical protein